MICTRCKYNGKGNNACLNCNDYVKFLGGKCELDETRLQANFIPITEEEMQENEQNKYITSLPPEIEDKLRKGLFDLFSLTPLELLTLQGIINRKSLVQIANELSKLFKNQNEITRFHTFQLRKSIARKVPHIKDVLLTSGQRKKLTN